ncbi:MAG: hypothetical protein J1E02_07025, partial [Coprobacter sp.]|nr:hypothetical protein [Coprobacter sp.]
MMSRIHAIDALVGHLPRIYLDIALTSSFFRRTCQKELVTVHFVNFITHLFFIISVVKSASLIYLQSIYSARFIWPILLLSKKRVILDAHGIVPEEEKNFLRHKVKSCYYGWVEKIVFRKASVVVCVTHAMKEYFTQKYPSFQGKYVVYSNWPASISMLKPESNDVVYPKNEKIEVLYSGGVNPWQNIDLMMQAISQKQNPEIHYTILTNSVERINAYIGQYNIDNRVIDVASVAPEELAQYYRKADYAFILRDDNPVNRVANPTKMVEYLFYGIVPIVLSPRIGDFEHLGYEYITLEQFVASLQKPDQKSRLNMNIAQSIIDDNKAADIKSMVLEML